MKEKFQFLNQFPLKIIALLTMLVDHVGLFMMLPSYFAIGSLGYKIGYFLRIVGRISFPLFILMLAEGLRKTHDRLNYVLRFAILWCAITVANIALYLIVPDYSVGAQAFTDLLCYSLFIYLLEHKKKTMRFLSLLPLGYIILSYACGMSEYWALMNGQISVWSESLPVFLRCGYSLYGLLMFLGIYYAPTVVNWFYKTTMGDLKDEMEEWSNGPRCQSLVNILSSSSIIIFTLIFWLIEKTTGIMCLGMSIQSYCVLSCLLIYCYNGKRGYDAKWFRWFQYLFYPVHLVLIFGVFALFF